MHSAQTIVQEQYCLGDVSLRLLILYHMTCSDIRLYVIVTRAFTIASGVVKSVFTCISSRIFHMCLFCSLFHL